MFKATIGSKEIGMSRSFHKLVVKSKTHYPNGELIEIREKLGDNFYALADLVQWKGNMHIVSNVMGDLPDGYKGEQRV